MVVDKDNIKHEFYAKGYNMIEIINTQCHSTSSIRASCFHDVTNKLAFGISIKDKTIDYNTEKFVNCSTSMVVCFKCFVFYLMNGLIIFTKKSESKWMKRT